MANPGDQYQLYRGDDRQWWWRFVTANGKVIFRSTDGYVNRGDAIHSINIARASGNAQCIEQKDDGKWHNFQP